MNPDLELIQNVINKLCKKGYKLASAESMTGGMFAKLVTDFPGTSAVFDRALVTYSNESKMSVLDVCPETIEEYGAISRETAIEMVEGLRIYSMCDVCISVTGNAGPVPSENKPLGMYYVALYCSGITEVFKFESELSGRDEIRVEACNNMFKLIYDRL